MKKAILILSLLLITTTTLFAQQDVTKFMGIPVDGSRAEMVTILKAKGFTNATDNNEMMQGTFYGSKSESFHQNEPGQGI